MMRGFWMSLLATIALGAFAGPAHAQRWGNRGWNRGGFSIGIGNYGYGYGNWGGYYQRGYGYGGYHPYGTGYFGYYSPRYYNNYSYGSTFPQYPAYTYGYYAQPNYGYYSGTVNQGQAQQAQGSQPMQYDELNPSGTKARLRVTVPSPNAQLTINGVAMRQMGSTRVFDSPPLEPNKSYRYTVKASWMENGREVTQEKDVNVSPGQVSVASFSQDMGGTRTESMYPTQPGVDKPGDVKHPDSHAKPNSATDQPPKAQPKDQPRHDAPGGPSTKTPRPN